MSKTEREKKYSSAGKEDKIRLNFTECAGNEEKSELRIGEGKEYNNDGLLELLENSKKIPYLSLKTSEHTYEIDDNGEIVRNNRVPARNKEEKEEMSI